MKKYASFLICFHEAHTDIYLSGIPLAVVHGDDVSPCFLSGANGEKRQINLGAIPDCPFSSVEELHEAVVDTLSKFSKTNFEDAPSKKIMKTARSARKLPDTAFKMNESAAPISERTISPFHE